MKNDFQPVVGTSTLKRPERPDLLVHAPKTHQTVHPRTPTEIVAWGPALNMP